jgi:hypothetical protein
MTGVKMIGAALLLAGISFGTAAQADTGRASIEGISSNQNNTRKSSWPAGAEAVGEAGLSGEAGAVAMEHTDPTVMTGTAMAGAGFEG